MHPHRASQLRAWLEEKLQSPVHLEPLEGDASFRRYFRLQHEGKRLIAADAPPEQENNRAFQQVAKVFAKAGVSVPMLYEIDLDHGWLLLSDVGDKQYLQVLKASNADALYQQALDQLLLIQTCQFDSPSLPLFDAAFMQKEFSYFVEWFLRGYCQLSLSVEQQQLLREIEQQLIDNALAQPQVCIHRDYHSRNLLVGDKGIAVIDFQDAMQGPITYDLVSLLRDCYVTWPKQKVKHWQQLYQQQALQQQLLTATEAVQLPLWFDWMGLQRHIKVVGIFSRLFLRDGRSHYLQDIPRGLNYLLTVSKQYPNLQKFHQFITEMALQFDKASA